MNPKEPGAERKGPVRILRRLWAILGGGALVVFVVWSALAYRATDEARAALVSDARVQVIRGEGHWRWFPREGLRERRVGLLFFPGALVEPAAYAPLARAIAVAGYPVLLVELPRRGVLGGADGAESLGRAAMRGWPEVAAWVVAGHSRGAVAAASLARQGGPDILGLVLAGTTHPRDFSLADSNIVVTKVVATRDGIASMEASEANRHLLPKAVRWVIVEGGNHSQFGFYGFQPGDRFAAIDRDQQFQLTLRAFLSTLEEAGPPRGSP